MAKSSHLQFFLHVNIGFCSQLLLQLCPCALQEVRLHRAVIPAEMIWQEGAKSQSGCTHSTFRNQQSQRTRARVEANDPPKHLATSAVSLFVRSLRFKGSIFGGWFAMLTERMTREKR